MVLKYKRGSTWFTLNIPKGENHDFYISQVCPDEYILYSNYRNNEIVEHEKFN